MDEHGRAGEGQDGRRVSLAVKSLPVGEQLQRRRYRGVGKRKSAGKSARGRGGQESS